MRRFIKCVSGYEEIGLCRQVRTPGSLGSASSPDSVGRTCNPSEKIVFTIKRACPGDASPGHVAPRAGLEPATLRLRLVPKLSLRSGLSLHPPTCPASRNLSRMPGALGVYRRESSSPSLCTFPATTSLFAGLRSGLPCPTIGEM